MTESLPNHSRRASSVSIPLQRRERHAAQSLGGHVIKSVKESRVLLVGAGGIGCEILKNLVCSGFGSGVNGQSLENGGAKPSEPEPTLARRPEIVVVDLDTIDLSNLNRQFLFRKHHIKKSKATVAKDTASQFNPHAKIDAHHSSIFDDRYDVAFFEGFDIVFNALDNLAARRQVNRMCLAADVPLIESGTTGFNGQVQAIRKSVTECYDCNPKPVQKSFPICTIRSTPSQPIHCIVWAKSYLFPELFGRSEEESSDVGVTETDDADEVAKLKEEAEALKKVKGLMGSREFAQNVFNKIFHDDIERLRTMSEMWQHRTPPESLKFEALTVEPTTIKQGQALSSQDQQVWTLLENISVFCYSLDALSSRVQAGEKVIEFDKDDKDTLDFVASAANLRSHIFGIPLHSEWEIKQMAGNIIPAIATSNALTASICVLEAFKIIRNTPPEEPSNASTNGKDSTPLGGAKEVFLTSRNVERMITAQPLALPNPNCPVCSPVYAKLSMLEGAACTVGQLVELLKQRVDYNEISIAVDGVGVIYDPDLDDNLTKTFSDLGISGSKTPFMTITDDNDEDQKVDLVLSSTVHPKPSDGQEVPVLNLLPKTIVLPLKPKRAPPHDGSNGLTAASDGVDPIELDASPTGVKRKRDLDEELGSTNKRTKAGDEATVVEDSGAIVLDD